MQFLMILLLGIMLSRIKIGMSEIRRALLELDDQKLSIDDLRAIGRQLPTSEEVRVLPRQDMRRS